jgi:hypothetical protein
MYVIVEKCVETQEVHRAGWGGSGAGGRTLPEDRYGPCLSIRRQLVGGRMNKLGMEWWIRSGSIHSYAMRADFACSVRIQHDLPKFVNNYPFSSNCDPSYG